MGMDFKGALLDRLCQPFHAGVLPVTLSMEWFPITNSMCSSFSFFYLLFVPRRVSCNRGWS